MYGLLANNSPLNDTRPLILRIRYCASLALRSGPSRVFVVVLSPRVCSKLLLNARLNESPPRACFSIGFIRLADAENEDFSPRTLRIRIVPPGHPLSLISGTRPILSSIGGLVPDR